MFVSWQCHALFVGFMGKYIKILLKYHAKYSLAAT